MTLAGLLSDQESCRAVCAPCLVSNVACRRGEPTPSPLRRLRCAAWAGLTSRRRPLPILLRHPTPLHFAWRGIEEHHARSAELRQSASTSRLTRLSLAPGRYDVFGSSANTRPCLEEPSAAASDSLAAKSRCSELLPQRGRPRISRSSHASSPLASAFPASLRGSSKQSLAPWALDGCARMYSLHH